VAGLLDGLRILDFGIWRPVPYATALMADLGADVIKVEPPGGDPMRAFPELFDDLNGNKRAVVLDLKQTADRARAAMLVDEADAVVEGFRPGVADRLGIGWEAVHGRNPRAVYLSLSGYGTTPPLADVPGHDINYQARAGCLVDGHGGILRPLVPIADLGAGVFAAFALLAAVRGAERTGVGERIDLAMTDILATWAGTGDGGTRLAGGGELRGVPGYGTYACADGHVAIGIVGEDPFWISLCDALGFGDVRDLDFSARAASAPELDARVAAGLRTFTRDDAVAMLVACGVPVSPVRTRSEVGADPLLRDRGVITVDDDGRPHATRPVRFTTRGALPPRPAPPLDTDADPRWT
jgi:alpha-methylacyl-CoA racemase